tara:strand:+ start:1577 stop:1948 length:372 start_codon:yes stop_codon:yes gene_type:complete
LLDVGFGLGVYVGWVAVSVGDALYEGLEEGDVGHGGCTMEYEVAQPAGQTVAQLVTVGIESQPQDWVMVEIWRQARRMQEVMAVQLGSSVEVIVRQVVGVGSGGYGVIVGGRGVSARMRGARR